MNFIIGGSFLTNQINCLYKWVIAKSPFYRKRKEILQKQKLELSAVLWLSECDKNWVKGTSIYRHIIRKHYCIQTYLLLCHKNSDLRPLHSKNYATMCSELMILSPLKQLLWRCQVYGKSQQAGFSKIDWKWLPRGRACNAWTSVYFTSKDQRW